MKKLKITAFLLAFAGFSTLTLTACDEKEPPFILNESLIGGNVGEVKLESGDKYVVIVVQGFEGEIKIKLLPECAPVAVQNFIDLAQSGYYDGKKIHRVMSDFMIQGGSPNGDGLSDPNANSFGVERSYNARHFYGALSMANSAGQNSEQFFIVNDKRPDDPTSNDAEQFKREAESYKQVIDMYNDSLSEDALDFYRRSYQNYLRLYRATEDFKANLSDEIIEKYKSGGASFLDGGYTVFGQTIEGFDVIDAVSAVEVVSSDPDNPNSEKSVPVQAVIIESVKIYTYE